MQRLSCCGPCCKDLLFFFFRQAENQNETESIVIKVSEPKPSSASWSKHTQCLLCGHWYNRDLSWKRRPGMHFLTVKSQLPHFSDTSLGRGAGPWLSLLRPATDLAAEMHFVLGLHGHLQFFGLADIVFDFISCFCQLLEFPVFLLFHGHRICVSISHQ